MYKNLSPGAIGISAKMREALRLATLGKFEGMALPLAEATVLAGDKGAPYVKALYDSFSLRIGEWSLPVAWNGPDEVFNKDLEQLRIYAALAAELGAFRTATWIPSWSDERPFD